MDGFESIAAALRRLPGHAVLSGRTAAWLHGLESPLCSPIEVTLPPGTPISRRAGLRIHRCRLDIDEIVLKHGLAITSPVRTIADHATWVAPVETVVVLDAALHGRFLSVDDLQCWIHSHSGCKGVARLRRVMDLAEPKTESPMETRLRLLLVQAGLPRPSAQVPLYDDSGTYMGRPDLYYPDQRVGIEYDGTHHRESLVVDNRRQNLIQEAGYLLLRFTASDVLQTPLAVVATVRRTLAART